jgi:hypothetical protein
VARIDSAFGLAALALGALGATACSNNSSGGNDAGSACAQFTDNVDLTTPTVSLKSDVVPIFQASCSLSSSCHGDPNTGGPGGLFLGPMKGQPVDTAKLLVALAASTHEQPRLQYVVPGDPKNSYLMHKMDGDQCLFDAKCTTDQTFNTPICPEAGVAMPQSSGLLDVTTRDTVRRWIAQGAKDN